MPRQSRIDVPGALHHVMSNGINGQDIFKDKKDFEHFLKRMGELFSETGSTCYAWALMRDHFHLLMRSGEIPLSSMMRRLLTGHAIYFNRRHGRSGHLFQNRFKSILCEEDLYFLQLVRYIHLNPIRSGTVKTIKSLNKYPYTGHAMIMGELNNDWQDIDYTLKQFGKQKKRSRTAYLEYARDGVSEGIRDDLTGGGILRTVGGWKELKEIRKRGESTLGDERILGKSTFIKKVLKSSNEKFHLKDLKKSKYSLQQLTRDACNFYKVNITDVRSPSKQRHLKIVKSIICYVAVRQLFLKGTEVSDYLNISRSTVSKLVSGFKKDADTREFIKKHVNTK